MGGGVVPETERRRGYNISRNVISSSLHQQSVCVPVEEFPQNFLRHGHASLSKEENTWSPLDSTVQLQIMGFHSDPPPIVQIQVAAIACDQGWDVWGRRAGYPVLGGESPPITAFPEGITTNHRFSEGIKTNHRLSAGDHH